MIKLTKIEAGELSDLLKSVYECVSVNKELSRCLLNVKIVLEEGLNGHKGLAVKRLERSLVEDLA